MSTIKGIIMVLLFFLCFQLKAQHTKIDNSSMVNSFLKAVFNKNESTEKVIDNYVYFSPKKNVSSIEQRAFFTAMIDSLKKENSAALASGNYKIVDYQNYNAKKVNFGSNPGEIKIVIIEQKPAFYFSLKERKIVSFSYLLKGDLAFFIVP